MRKSERSINLVRNVDSDAYQVVNDGYEMLMEYSKYTLIPERPIYDDKSKTHVHYYIRMPR